MNDEDIQDERDVISVDGIVIHIPICCSEGRDDCKHAVQKERISKRNIAI
jgi:hypothetical protein